MRIPRISFVGYGTMAPSVIPEYQVWLDVGGRVDERIFDHHEGGQERSTAELVLKSWRRLTSIDPDNLELVLHVRPDVDAVVASWLVMRIVTDGAPPEPDEHVREMLAEVTRHDQGLPPAGDLLRDWPIALRTELSLQCSDTERLHAGIHVTEETLQRMQGEGSLGDAVASIISVEGRSLLESAESAHVKDCAAGQVFEVLLPTADGAEGHPPVRGLWLNDPKGPLFKELSRRDGYVLLVVSRPIACDPPRWRHILSVPGNAPVSLRGVGSILEQMEREKEDSLGLPLPPGRRRSTDGGGRFGTGVESPWYDGRGHAYRIVDSPVVEPEGTSVCGSLLEPAEVLRAVQVERD